MRGTAAALVCLISLHYLSVVDAYAARFTSENGMPGREHEDKRPRRSSDVKRRTSASPDYHDDWYYYENIDRDVARGSYLARDENGRPSTSPQRQLSSEDILPARSAGAKKRSSSSPDDNMRQIEYDNFEYYGGIVNIPPLGSYGYGYRDADIDMDPDSYTTGDENGIPARSADAKKRSPGNTMRQIDYDDWEHSGGIPNMPPYGHQYRDADVEVDTDADKNGFSKTLERMLSPIVDTLRQLWGKLSGLSLGGGSEGVDTKRQREPLKRVTENRNGDDQENKIGNPLNYLIDIARKALDFAYKTIDEIDVSQLTEETKKLKEAVLDILKNAKKALEDLLNKVIRGVESAGGDLSPSSRRARSVRKRTNARDALDSYLTSLRSQKRSKARNSLRLSAKRNRGEPNMDALFDLMAEIEECINNTPPANSSLLGVKCIVTPLMKAIASSEQGGAFDLTPAVDSNVRSDAIGSVVNLRRLNFPWGSIFLIPIYNGQSAGGNSTVPPLFDQECVNVTTTTMEPGTTTSPSTTEALDSGSIYDEPDDAVRSGSRYRSKYDHDF